MASVLINFAALGLLLAFLAVLLCLGGSSLGVGV